MNMKPYVAFPCSPPVVYVDHQRQASAQIQAISRRSTLSHSRQALAPVLDLHSATRGSLLEDIQHLSGCLRAPLVETKLGTGLLQHCRARSRVQDLLDGLQPHQLSLSDPPWATASLDIGVKPRTVVFKLETPLLPPDKVWQV